MKKILLTLAATATLALATTMCTSSDSHQNPFLTEWDTPYHIPDYSKISIDDYIPAMKAGIDEQNSNIHEIVANTEAPTFENTIVALENSSPILDRVSAVLFGLKESDADSAFTVVVEEFVPAVTKHSDMMYMNDSLFQRVKAVYDNRASLDTDQQRLTEKYYRNFVRSGALLNSQDKEALLAVNEELANLYLQFNNNLLAANNAFQLVVDDPARLSGLPKSNIEQAAEAAQKKGLGDGKYLFTLHAPSRLPLLQYADDRDLRRQMYEGYTTQGFEGENSNLAIINKILQARAKKAKLLGFDNYGAYATSDKMAGSVENAENLLLQIWAPAIKRAKEEVAEMQAIVNEAGDTFKIAPWDYYYYAEKVRQKKYDLDEATVREYFALDSVLNGAYYAAEKLYGINFTEIPDAPKYHPEVTVYDVTDAQSGEHVAVFMTDYFPRETKRQGAWMEQMTGSWLNADGSWSRPIVYNVASLTKPTADTPSLLTIDEVETLFHEFGHALHGMLSRARYNGISGTNTDRDFVELPSQINEHWAFTPELLSVYAHHYKTGEPIPAELIDKIVAAGTHNQGFMTTELVGAALLDLEYSKLNPESDIDIVAFEKGVADKLGMPAEITFRYRSPYFKHIFGDEGYAAGYYTYLWAEVLDTDGFELFTEKGVFDPATAKSFKENILEKGDSEDPMVLFERFRGHKPSVDALLRNRGLK